MNFAPRILISWLPLVVLLHLSWQQSALPRDNQANTMITNDNSTITAMSFKQSGIFYERTGDAKRASKHPNEAFEAYKNALDAFSRTGNSVNRYRLLKKLSKKLPGWPATYQIKMKKLHKAWKKIRLLSKQAFNLPRRPTGSEELDTDAFQIAQEVINLAELAKKQNDRELLALALEVEGRTLAAAGYIDDELTKYRQAADACSNGACPKTRQAILNRAAKISEKQSNLLTAFELFTLANAEDTLGLPEDKRRYRRSQDMLRLCKKLISTKALTSCLELERKVTGFATFTDFSTPPPAQKLRPDQTREVHSQYLPLLAACLRKATHKGEIEPGEILELSWTVLNNGNTGSFTCYPSVEGSELEICFRKALAFFRYPRYLGERQNVTLPLSVGGN